jgi:hypothetical protein
MVKKNSENSEFTLPRSGFPRSGSAVLRKKKKTEKREKNV